MKKANVKKKKTIDNHYRSTLEQRELINREIVNLIMEGNTHMNLNEYHRLKMFPKDWEKKLKELRERQRSQGLADSFFLKGII